MNTTYKRLLGPDSYVYKTFKKDIDKTSILETRDAPINQWLIPRRDIVGYVNYFGMSHTLNPIQDRYFALILSDSDYKHAIHKKERSGTFYLNKKLNINLKVITIDRINHGYQNLCYQYYLNMYSCKMYEPDICIQNFKRYHDNRWYLSNILINTVKLYNKYTKGTKNYDYNIEAIYFMEQQSISEFILYFNAYNQQTDEFIKNLNLCKNVSNSPVKQIVPPSPLLKSKLVTTINKPIIEKPKVESLLVTRLKLIDL